MYLVVLTVPIEAVRVNRLARIIFVILGTAHVTSGYCPWQAGPMVATTMTSRLGYLLRDRRHRARLTQSELAEQIGVSRSYVKKMENEDGIEPSIAILNKMARVLPVSALELAVAIGLDVGEEYRAEAAFFAELLDAGDEAAEDVRARFRRLQRRLIGGDDEPLPSA